MLILGGCTQSVNDKNAYILHVNGKTYLEFSGQRPNGSLHNLSVFFSTKTHPIGALLLINEVRDGVMTGKDIPTLPGRYNLFGEIYIKKDFMRVNLLFDDTDSHKPYPYEWNGEYHLANR